MFLLLLFGLLLLLFGLLLFLLLLPGLLSLLPLLLFGLLFLPGLFRGLLFGLALLFFLSLFLFFLFFPLCFGPGEQGIDQGEVVAGVGVPGITGQGLAVGVGGTAQIAELHQGVAQVVERVGAHRCALHLPEGLGGAVVMAGAVPGHALAIRIAKSLCRLFVAALAVGGHARLFRVLEQRGLGGGHQQKRDQQTPDHQ